MRLKSKTSSHVKYFIYLIQTQFHKTIKTIRTDNGSELFLSDFYAKHGILNKTSCVDTP